MDHHAELYTRAYFERRYRKLFWELKPPANPVSPTRFSALRRFLGGKK